MTARRNTDVVRPCWSVATVALLAIAACRTDLARSRGLLEGGRLLDGLDAATIRGVRLPMLPRDRPLADPATELYRAEFARPLDPDWFDETWRRGVAAGTSPDQRPRATIASDSTIGGVRLVDPSETLYRFVPVLGAEPLRVRARVRPIDGGDAPSLELWVIPHPTPAPSRDELAPRVKDPGTEWLARRVKASANRDGDAWNFDVVLPSDLSRHCVSVALIPQGKGVVVEWIEVRRTSLLESLCATPKETLEREVHPLRRKIHGSEDLWDGLLLPSGASATFPVVIPAEHARLELGAGAWALDGGGSIELAVAIDGHDVASRSIKIEPHARQSAIEPWTIPLASGPGAVSLSLEVRGDPAAVGFFGAPALLGTPSEPPKRNLLLISIDTLRSDHVGCYGQGPSLTPCIDALAGSGLRFAQATAPTSYTLPSHVSLMTGQHPIVHHVIERDDRLDPAHSPTLAWRLRELGYRTAAFTGGGYLSPHYGFEVGFERYSTADPGDDRDATDDRLTPVVDWLTRNADQPFFLFIHSYVVHNYAPRLEYMRKVGEPGTSPSRDEILELQRKARFESDAEAAKRLCSLYRPAVAQADERLVGRLLATLRALNLTERTLVCLVGDHGEQFNEHGDFGHGRTLWTEVTSVPWLLAGPGVPRGAVEAERVGLEDVAPTLAGLLELPGGLYVGGRDRLRASSESEEPRLLLLRESGRWPAEGIIAGPWKLLRQGPKDDQIETTLFRIDRDPAERVNLFASEGKRAALLESELEREKARMKRLGASLPSSARDAGVELPDDVRQRLQALGYPEDK